MAKKQGTRTQPRFPAVPLAQISRRAGKHNGIVRDILTDLARLDEYSAIKVDLAQAGKKKADLRAALHRAAKKQKVQLATSSDERYLYVFWSNTKTEIKNHGPLR